MGDVGGDMMTNLKCYERNMSIALPTQRATAEIRDGSRGASSIGAIACWLWALVAYGGRQRGRGGMMV